SKHDRSNGRIYRISYNNAKPVRVDLQKSKDDELVKLLTHENEWYCQHAQRVLNERSLRGGEDRYVGIASLISKRMTDTKDEKQRLRL
ncbi:hypothetical protein NL526_28430, partial [Klebsiella pneumoniae]|nr:hypothetical protein [Klebsiella pneumoniae]